LACHLQIDADPDQDPTFQFDADPDLQHCHKYYSRSLRMNLKL
jgi:hypothetical protein